MNIPGADMHISHTKYHSFLAHLEASRLGKFPCIPIATDRPTTNQDHGLGRCNVSCPSFPPCLEAYKMVNLYSRENQKKKLATQNNATKNAH